MGTARPEEPTMGWTDPREPDMSLIQQVPADPDAQPGRSAGVRLVIAVSVLVTVLAIGGIAYLILGDDEPAATPLPAPTAVEEPSPTAPAEPPSRPG